MFGEGYFSMTSRSRHQSSGPLLRLHFSWKDIRNAANKTDYELTVKLRNTQLYQVLNSPALSRNGLILPSEAAKPPTGEDIRPRWPGMAPNEIQGLVRDYERESRVILEEGPSDMDFTHVRRLVEEDFGRQI
jgi:nuclear pore complex protein Nup133